LAQARAAAARAGEETELVEQVRYYAARVERDRGNLNAARAEMEAVLASVESRRALIARESARATLLQYRLGYYELYVDVLMRLDESEPGRGHAATAFQVADRMRARTLLDLLAEAGVDARRGVDEALLAREQALVKALDRAAREQMRGTASAAPAGEAELARLTEEYDVLRAEIRRQNPRYATLTEMPRLTVAQAQAQLDPDTVLLAYLLGAQRSYLWVVSPSGLDTYRLPPRAEIERAALRLRALLAERPSPAAARDAEWGRAARELAALVLAPAAARLGARRLVVAADGALHLVPFAVLVAPAAALASPLVAAHEVVNVPSASVLVALRQEAAARSRPEKEVAVLADPVFEAGDPRVRRRGHRPGDAPPAPATGPLRAVDRAIKAAGGPGPHIARLPFTRREAAAATERVPAARALSALDFDASRLRVTRGDLEAYRIVHFASHGLVNADHPELSGIVLSLVDRQGQPQDGFLRLADVYGLRLRADLVVLSGCQTALGRQLRGEGLVGLTRGFMYAGAPRVLASLWKVDDRATAELMKRFYEALLGPRRLPPAAALRAAQESMWREPAWRDPF
ncbi:MAG TPA: CHAT domain-containing protein, partial [Vicinamibacteria bacterium]|nr:CHAT domain-containing protein [Vicinamibacteria bacterium]